MTIACIILLSSHRAPAQQSKAEPFLGFTKYLRYRVQYDVNSDGTHVETHEWAQRVLAEQGIEAVNRASVNFSDRLANAEILAAYTLKSGGRRIDVPKSNFQEETRQGRDGAPPMFSDIRTKTVAFPDVAVGDTVVMFYRLVQHQATFPGNFSFAETFSKFEVYDNVQVGLSAPATLGLQVFQRGVSGGEVARNNGRRNWLWTYRNERVAIPESGAVSPMDYGPLIVATTFKDYGALAAAYNSRAKPKAAVTPRIRQLAEQLTRNAHSPREQAKALYDWVATNIHYVVALVGVGAVVPHDADLVLADRMGDCKDHCTLLQSLLAARDIASTTVLVNASNAYSLPPAAAPEVFNHAINYLPALDLYLDSTARFTPFGTLPLGDADKPVIHTAGYTEIRHTPPITHDSTKWRATTVLTIHTDGSAEGETKIETSGLWAVDLRVQMTFLQPNMEDRMIRGALQRNGYTGTGTLTKDDPRALSDLYHYSAKYELTDALNLPGPGAVPIRSPFSGEGKLQGWVEIGSEPDRTVNFQCYGAYAKDEYTIHLPKNAEILAIPKQVNIERKDLVYRATYQLQGNTVVAVREIEDHTPGNACAPADWVELKAFSAAVRRDLRALILYR